MGLDSSTGTQNLSPVALTADYADAVFSGLWGSRQSGALVTCPVVGKGGHASPKLTRSECTWQGAQNTRLRQALVRQSERCCPDVLRR
jgi:hypothetical protein